MANFRLRSALMRWVPRHWIVWNIRLAVLWEATVENASLEVEKSMVEIGDLIKCPKCGNYGRVVWVSKDRQSAGVRCSSRHMFTPKLGLDPTLINRGKGRFEKNMVFLVKI